MVSRDYYQERLGNSPPYRRYNLDGVYSNVEQLADGGDKAFVNQGKAIRTTTGLWQVTEGLRECSPIFVKNKSSTESLLIHQMGWRLFPQQEEELRMLSPGEYDVFAVISEFSLVSSVSLKSDASSFVSSLKSVGVNPYFIGDIAVDSKRSSLDVAFNTSNSILRVITPRDGEILEFHIG